MGQAYLTAWTNAKSHRPNSPTPEKDQTQTHKALAEFMDNWTNDEFVGFVNDCEELVDGLIKSGDPLAARCEEVGCGCQWLLSRDVLM